MAITKIYPVPTLNDETISSMQKGIDIARGSIREMTDRAQRYKMRVYVVRTNGVAETVEIDTDLLRVTSGFAYNGDAGTFRQITVTPKATDTSVAVVANLAASVDFYVIVLFGA